MESESGQSDFTTRDPTKRIVKYFCKCLIELIKHAESIQYKNNKLVNYDISSTISYDSCNEIDITEHNIKSEIQRDGPIFKQIEKLKKCIVELLTICSQQNILIDYDTSKPHISIYDAFDDSQRILVMNHLTLHVLSLIENIYLSLKYFKSSKYQENGFQIRKTFSNIYKEIKSLPMQSDIIENMDSSFKSLTPKSEYIDSYNYLVDKLNILCKYVCKFSKSYSKKCGYTDLPMIEYSTDDDNSPRKKIEKRYVKPENGLNTAKPEEFMFKIPTIENTNCLQNTPKQTDDTRKKKKHKLNTNKENENNKNNKKASDRDLLLNSLLNENGLNTEEMEEIIFKVPTIENTLKQTDDTKKKKKEKLNTNTEDENGPNTKEMGEISCKIPTIENTNCLQNTLKQTDDTRKKKKDKLNTNTENENNKNNEIILERDLLLSTLLNDTINEYNTNSESKKKSKKSKKDKSIPEDGINDTLNTQLNEFISNNKTLNKDKANGNANKKQPKKRKTSKEENIKPITKKLKLTNEDELKNFAANSSLYDDVNQTINSNEDSIPADILNAIANGEIEIDYDKKDMEDFTKIVRENNLNENERFLYIQTLLDEANAKVAISEEKKEKLRNLKVLIDWEVPPAHLLCSNLSAGPNEQEKVLLAQIPVTTGQFSSKEDEIMRKNWKDFIEKHDLEDDPAPFMVLVIDNQMLLPYSERRKFLQYIGRGLPHKSLHSVFRRFKCLFKPKVKNGRFTPEEDELILTYLSKIRREDNKQKYARLAPLIKRDRLQIERRYRHLRVAANQNQEKVHWTLELKEKFLKHLLEESQITNVEELRDFTINFNMYRLLSKLMNIPLSKLRIHWNFRMHTELFALEPINTDLIKIKLIRKFHELGCDDWKTIDWSQMTAMFKGITKCYLWITFKNTINECVPATHHKNLKDCVNYMYTSLLPSYEKRLAAGESRIMPRLRYENGTLTYQK